MEYLKNTSHDILPQYVPSSQTSLESFTRACFSTLYTGTLPSDLYKQPFCFIQIFVETMMVKYMPNKINNLLVQKKHLYVMLASSEKNVLCRALTFAE